MIKYREGRNQNKEGTSCFGKWSRGRRSPPQGSRAEPYYGVLRAKHPHSSLRVMQQNDDDLLFIILKVLLTTWYSFWHYHYRLTRTLTSLTTQTDLSWTDGWSCYFISFETVVLKEITKYMDGRGYFSELLFIVNYSFFFSL